MTATVSPLDLVLDTKNPRFVILDDRSQKNIIEYLVAYEDVCELATSICEYGGLLPGERIVALEEEGHYVVVEGNRRACVLKLLLSRSLIPDKFTHRFPVASAELIENCASIEVDVLPDRKAALELMSKRHIEGVKQWKPLAKKQFFAVSFNDGNGKSVNELSEITGIKASEICRHIRDYKFFLSVYQKYCEKHPEYNKTIVQLKTDPFWRIFTVIFEYPQGHLVHPKDFLKIKYDKSHNTISELHGTLFEQITQLVFREAIVEERITTRHVLSDVNCIKPLLYAVVHDFETREPDGDSSDVASSPPNTGNDPCATDIANQGMPPKDNSEPAGTPDEIAKSGGPCPGGPAPRQFFEGVSWEGKLSPQKSEHAGLLISLSELYNISKETCKGKKAYQVFPVGTGMILRTVYEQALRLRMKEVHIWGAYMQTLKIASKPLLPTLKSMETYICSDDNLAKMFPDETLIYCFNRIKGLQHRDFLNANIHNPGEVCVTPESLESIASGGLYTLIQGIINYL